MDALGVTAIAVVAAVAAAYLVWRVRWGYPHQSIPRVLAYHKVTGFELGGTWVPPGRFISQIEMLLENGYRFIDEETFLEVIDGRRRQSSREVLLTFDDGYRILLSNAFPYLASRGIPSLVFLVSSYIGKENTWELYWPGRRFRHLDWFEARDLLQGGVSFGSHTRTHRNLTNLQREGVREELAGSKKEIEDRLGRPVYSLSYPFGRFDAGIIDETERAGYRAAFSLYPGRGCGRLDRYALRRDGVYIIDTHRSLRAKLGRDGLFWIEDLKGRVINGVAALTPFLKGMAKHI
ncbi:MAG: polysaccharide deacetylase family protein [bacterium]|nr:MAG: polysaccharide deacetylase family protein [bacterium]